MSKSTILIVLHKPKIVSSYIVENLFVYNIICIVHAITPCSRFSNLYLKLLLKLPCIVGHVRRRIVVGICQHAWVTVL